jgi:hypothetical protein
MFPCSESGYPEFVCSASLRVLLELPRRPPLRSASGPPIENFTLPHTMLRCHLLITEYRVTEHIPYTDHPTYQSRHVGSRASRLDSRHIPYFESICVWTNDAFPGARV